MTSAIFIYVTTENLEQARRIGELLVNERLIACANILPQMHSIYRWQGQVQKADECVLILKTAATNWTRVEQRVCELHSYECPCILALPIELGSAEYLKWIGENS
jgi:periplasmic divalent cation tolerance protein